MGTKEKLLTLLEAERGRCVSGQQIAGELGVSRAAVWKAVEALRGAGHRVEAAPGGGYTLAESSDVLSEQGILAWLEDKACAVRVFEEIDSTSLEAKRWAIDGAPHGALVVAQWQTGGRGRLGRSFQSPPGGLYMSMVLRPHVPVADAVLVTAGAAVATCEAVQALCGIKLGIKWVNDLFLGPKKVCGILSEAGTGVEEGSLEYIVVGIGINFSTPEEAFAKELRTIVGSLFPDGDAPVPRTRLIAAVHDRLLALFGALPDRGFLSEYRRRSFVLGREVTVLAKQPYAALAEEIDEDARLIMRCGDGTRVALASGEISIRVKEDA